jgi:hypothetical protein
VENLSPSALFHPHPMVVAHLYWNMGKEKLKPNIEKVISNFEINGLSIRSQEWKEQ